MVILFAFLVWSCFAIPTVIITSKIEYSIPSFHTRVILALCAVVACLILVIIRFNIPKYDDVWNLRKEIIAIIYINAICTVFVVILGVIIEASLGDWEYDLLNLIGMIIPFSWNIIMFGHLFYKFNLPSNVISCIYYKAAHQRINKLDWNHGQKSNVEQTTLNNTLSDDTQFHVFARHLSREFQIEVNYFQYMCLYYRNANT